MHTSGLEAGLNCTTEAQAMKWHCRCFNCIVSSLQTAACVLWLRSRGEVTRCM